MSLPIGTRVTITDRTRPRFDGEPGVIIAQNPPGMDEPEWYVVATCGQQPLFAPSSLRVEEES